MEAARPRRDSDSRHTGENDAGDDSNNRRNQRQRNKPCIQPGGLLVFALSLQAGGHLLVWFSLTWNLELYQQTNARLYRQGQSELVTITHLVAEGILDESVLLALDAKDAT